MKRLIYTSLLVLLALGGLANSQTVQQQFGTYANALRGQLPGTATNDSASAGNIGQIIESTILVGSAVPITSGASANITSIALTAGDWDVRGTTYTASSGSVTWTEIQGGSNTTSATLPTAGNGQGYRWGGSTTGQISQSIGTARFSVSSNTTVYLVINGTWTGGGTATAYGTIQARRMR